MQSDDGPTFAGKSDKSKSWDCFVHHVSLKEPKKVYRKCLPVYESIKIGLELYDIKIMPDKPKLLHNLPSISLKVNLYSCVGTSKKGELKVITRSDNYK